MKPKNIINHVFIAGWIAAMKTISSDDITNIRRTIEVTGSYHVESWYEGYIAALDHWDGLVSKYTEHAHDLNLVELYDGYHGQSNFNHPTIQDVIDTFEPVIKKELIDLTSYKHK